MAKKRMIKVRINSATGEIQSKAEGYEGGQCAKDIDALEALLGANKSSQHTKDFWKKEKPLENQQYQ